MILEDRIKYLLKNYFDTRETFSLEGEDIATSLKTTAAMTTPQQIEMLKKITGEKKFQKGLSTLFLNEIKTLLEEVEKY